MVRTHALTAALALALTPTALAQCGAGTPDASVTGSDSTYTTTLGAETVYTGGDYLTAIQTGLDQLASGQRLAVIASGSIGANTITLPSGATLEGCGTIDVAHKAGRGAIESTDTTGASIPYLTMTGAPYFGLRFSGVTDLALGDITLTLSGGLGIRFDRDRAASANVTMGTVTVTGAGSHAVETWNIDGLEIGAVVAKDVGESGLLVQNSRNVHVGLVDGDNVGAGTGYATLRFANTNGLTAAGDYATNVYVDKVVSRGGGRGVFCVSESGAAEIKEIDLADNGSNAILVENCYNVQILGGTVQGGGEVRVAAREEFAPTRDVSIAATVNDCTVKESPCADNMVWDISGDAAMYVC